MHLFSFLIVFFSSLPKESYMGIHDAAEYTSDAKRNKTC